VDAASGERFNGYEIALPPTLTKGGNRTGEAYYLYATALRLSGWSKCAFQLRNNPRAFIFGDEQGHVASFRCFRQALFSLAALEWRRERGLLWARR
jgi:hypothetical protein